MSADLCGLTLRTRVPLDDVEQALVATLASTLCDPNMGETRRRLRTGEIALCIEGDEVTWMDTDVVASDLANRLAAAAEPRICGRAR